MQWTVQVSTFPNQLLALTFHVLANDNNLRFLRIPFTLSLFVADSAASSVSWRLSPSSSGYKSQSQMSESVTPSPTSTPHPMGDSRQNSNGSSENQENRGGESSVNHIVWAVTDIHNVPKGSIIINPQVGSWEAQIREIFSWSRVYLGIAGYSFHLMIFVSV